MNKIQDIFNKLKEKWNNLSVNKKILITITAFGIIFSLILLFTYFNRVTYSTLFTDVDAQDASKIIEKLKSDKISYKVEGNTILVPKDKVDELRISVLSDGYLPSNGKGWALFDESKFGVTDTEAKVMYQRALQDELAKTIMSFDEVEKARVMLVLPDDTVFARESENARASVALKLKGTSTLSQAQVKAIIALVSGSVKNLPKENVEVIDSNMNLLSENIFDDVNSGTVSAFKQRDIEKQFESSLQNDLKKILGDVFGYDKVSVKVNADLDFDSKQVTTIKYDKDSIIRSQSKIKETSNDSTGNNSGTSPIDNFMTNTTNSTTNQSSSTNREEETTNYEIGQTEEKTIKAPGEVRRMTVSVLIDGNINNTERNQIKNIVAAATGYDEKRGDQISIEAMPFNNDLKEKQEEQLKLMQEQEAREKKIKLYTTIGMASGAGILLIALIIFITRKLKKSKKDEDLQPKPIIDVVVGDDVIKKQPPIYEPVLEEEEDRMDIEKEIKQYASKKPDQVVEVIKTWLSEDER
ncbi:flagellar M-ring protein FliF [Caloramator sp. E03]|uniref:flagellar basal-body MS-ring/collar protein FliF n=1 Tax=Caloramator sp. E03 TaxID=2576307 RepID=UPI00111045B9|nr:flagellar basal-body MS-ring/collar protein FliF [Caloramator sp. E03]QCX32353.1 flagellar M-ring protein FliF [Caloramator sp. E03]